MVKRTKAPVPTGQPWTWHWFVFRTMPGGTEKVLADGHAPTREAARNAAMEAEKPFPVSWLPEVHYAVADGDGQFHASPGVWWIPKSTMAAGRT